MSVRSDLLNGLTARGWVAFKKTNLHVSFNNPAKPGVILHLGNKGSLRLGRTIGESVPVRPFYKEMLIESGRAAEAALKEVLSPKPAAPAGWDGPTDNVPGTCISGDMAE